MHLNCAQTVFRRSCDVIDAKSSLTFSDRPFLVA
jgi:hypothetical protein